MKVLLNVPYYTGSHKYWADNLIRFSSHDIKLLSMSGRHWKWRMQGSAIHLAKETNLLNWDPELIICSTMMDVSLYRSLLRRKNVPIIYYMHENQLTYPFSKNDKRKKEEFHYGFINYKSCLSSDLIFFNSHYHQVEFMTALKSLLKRLPDYKSLDTIEDIKLKSKVLGVGIDLSAIDQVVTQYNIERKMTSCPTLLWNHRWESDKNPLLFLKLCDYLAFNEINFKLILLGKDVDDSTVDIHKEIAIKYSDKIVHDGYVDNYYEYIALLYQSNLLPVTNHQDFYGLSVLEAIYCGVTPILPSLKVYDEHLSEEMHSEFYYSNEDQLFQITKKFLLNQKMKDFKSIIRPKYDIRNVLLNWDLYIKELFNVFVIFSPNFFL